MKQALGLMLLMVLFQGCTPEVGSEEWCKDMKDVPSDEWTMRESKDYAKHCLFR